MSLKAYLQRAASRPELTSGHRNLGDTSDLDAEVDGLREAVRLNWLEMEDPRLSHAHRRAIRANIERLNALIASRSNTGFEMDVCTANER
jgi:hypothetical protein